MKILLLDIETAPNLVHVWGLWQQNVGINQIINSGYVMCWAAKWYGEDEIFFNSIHKTNRKNMIKSIHTLMDKADIIIHYNGSSFDIPTLNKEFLLHNLNPPSTYAQIDLLKTTRRQFKFASNKLDYVCQMLGLGKKVEHVGHQLWIDCMEKKPEAWKVMEKYNCNDVVILEKLYDRLKPWIKNHPNIFNEESGKCPTCGSNKYHSRGFAYTNIGKYRRFQCTNCHSWFKSKENLLIDNGNDFRRIN